MKNKLIVHDTFLLAFLHVVNTAGLAKILVFDLPQVVLD